LVRTDAAPYVGQADEQKEWCQGDQQYGELIVSFEEALAAAEPAGGERRKRKAVTASKIAHTRSPPELTGFRRLCSVPHGGPLLAG
jgi:hypothetical protein